MISYFDLYSPLSNARFVLEFDETPVTTTMYEQLDFNSFCAYGFELCKIDSLVWTMTPHAPSTIKIS